MGPEEQDRTNTKHERKIQLGPVWWAACELFCFGEDSGAFQHKGALSCPGNYGHTLGKKKKREKNRCKREKIRFL